MKKIVSILVFILSISFANAQADTMKTALVLIDIQNDYFKDGKMALYEPEKAGENAGLILNEFRDKSNLIVHIQHIATSPNATFFIPNTFGAEIHASVKPAGSEKIITKLYPNAFRETELLEYLNNLGVSKLVICGMMTHMCLEATARAAKDYGFKCVVIGDACATKDLEIWGESVKATEVQKAFLGALNGYYASVITAANFLKK